MRALITALRWSERDGEGGAREKTWKMCCKFSHVASFLKKENFLRERKKNQEKKEHMHLHIFTLWDVTQLGHIFHLVLPTYQQLDDEILFTVQTKIEKSVFLSITIEFCTRPPFQWRGSVFSRYHELHLNIMKSNLHTYHKLATHVQQQPRCSFFSFLSWVPNLINGLSR